MTSPTEKYWFQDLNNTLLDTDKLNQFIPKKTMTYPEKVNAIVRCSIYIGVILTVFHKNYLYLYVPIIAMVGTAVLYLLRQASAKTEKSITENERKLSIKDVPSGNQVPMNNNSNILEHMTDTECSMPTEDNPFDNFMPFDNRKKTKICSPEVVKQSIEDNFNKGLYKSVGDIFNKSNGQQRYYTMPNTEAVNNQSGFANWLYNTGSSCKEGNARKCHLNNPARQQGSAHRYQNNPMY